MPSLHHGAILIGAFLIVTGGSTAFLASSQSRLQAFSLCCVVLGVVMLILGLFWAVNSAVNYNHREFDPECPHYPYDNPNFGSHPLFTPPGSRFPESQSGFLPRWVKDASLLHNAAFHRSSYISKCHQFHPRGRNKRLKLLMIQEVNTFFFPRITMISNPFFLF